MSIFENFEKKLQAEPKSIVFTEGTDARILSAASRLLAGKTLKVILLGEVEAVKKAAADGSFDITGAEIITYGAPVLPGAMFLVSYLDGVPVCGLPGCVMYAKRTIFDLLLPRLLADDPITAEDIARLGEGGLCLGCAECHWPNCGFGHC